MRELGRGGPSARCRPPGGVQRGVGVDWDRHADPPLHGTREDPHLLWPSAVRAGRDARARVFAAVPGAVRAVPAEKIGERLEREGFTAEQIKALGVSEANIRPVARLRRKP